MAQAGIMERPFEPGQDLKAEIVMLGVAEEAGTRRQFTVRRRPRAWHLDQTDIAEIVARQGLVGDGGRIRNNAIKAIGKALAPGRKANDRVPRSRTAGDDFARTEWPITTPATVSLPFI